MKVLFINDSTSNPNWGDRGAAISLRAMIGAKGGHITHTISEHDLFATSFCEPPSISSGEENSIRERMRPFLPPIVLEARRKMLRNADTSRRRLLIPMEWGGFETLARTVTEKRTWPHLLDAVADIDLAIVHGDGSMVGNGLHPRSLLFLSYLIKKHLGKPVIIVNHTADFDHSDLLAMAEKVYPLFDDVVFRDQVSADRCRGFCEGRFVPDTAFWFKPAPRETWAPLAGRFTYFDVWPDVAEFDPARPYLCVGGSSALGAIGNTDSIAEGYVSLIESLREQYHGQIVLTVSDLVDQGVFRPIADRLGLPLVGLATPVQQAVDILGNADAYIGGRWHPAIYALRGGVPVLALSAKTFKMEALVSMAGLSESAFDVFGLCDEAARIGERLQSYLEQGDDLRGRLQGWAEEMAAKSWDNVRYLDEAI